MFLESVFKCERFLQCFTVFAQIGQVVALKGDVKVERESKIQELLLKDKILKNF